ncbi:MAG: HepT-like ribonuclease domain-containing protein [Planctomycetota bacterium]
MSRRPAELLLADMWEAIEKIERYRAGLDRDAFQADEKTVDSVVRNLEVIGEAANRLPAEFKASHSDVEWTRIVGLRHRIVHDYFGIDLGIIWEVLQKDLPAFKQRLARLREERGPRG